MVLRHIRLKISHFKDFLPSCTEHCTKETKPNTTKPNTHQKMKDAVTQKN